MLFLAILLKQIIWIALMPLWQTPDEQAHFAQVQNTAENNLYRYEKRDFPTTTEEIVIAETRLGTLRDARGNNLFTYHPDYKISYTNTLVGKYEKEINRQKTESRKKLLIKEATNYPPLYYEFAAFGYKLVYHAGLIDRVFFVRVWQTLIYFLTIIVYYLAAKEILAGSKEAVFFTAAMAFLPMPTFVAAGVTSDNLMNLLFSIILYMGILVVKRGYIFSVIASFPIFFALGVLTKPHFALALPIFLAAVFIRAAREGKTKNALFVATMATGCFAIFYERKIYEFSLTKKIGSLFFETGVVSLTDSLRKNNLVTYLFISLQQAYRQSLPWFWGIFRWLSLSLDRWYYRLWNLITLASVLSLGWCLLKKKLTAVNIFLIISILIYCFGLFFGDYLFLSARGYSFGLQGRYYFPVLLPILYLIYNFSPIKRWLIFFTIGANIYALLKISLSYYSGSSVITFIQQASQYKPWYFKGAALIFWIIAAVAVLGLLFIKLLRCKQ